jgi:PKD repeat protein
MLNPYFKRDSYWNMRSIILFCLFLCALFFICPGFVKAAVCVQGSGVVGIESISVSIDNLALTVMGEVTGGDCQNACSYRDEWGEWIYGFRAVEDSVQDLQYQIDSTAGTWTNLTKSVQWDLFSPASPTECTDQGDFFPSEYILNTSTVPISIAGLPISDNHILYIRAVGSNAVFIAEGSIQFSNQPMEFSLDPVFGAGSVYQGESNSVVVTVTRISGNPSVVTLGYVNPPPDSTVSFSAPGACMPNNTCTLTMTVATQFTAAPGVYPITITGTSGTVSHTNIYNLTVKPALPLHIDVTAVPSVGYTPGMISEIIVDIGGFATGLIDIQVDCGDDDNPQLLTVNGITPTSYHFTPGCGYYTDVENTYTVSAQATRGGYVATNTAMVSVLQGQVSPCAQSVSGGGFLLAAGLENTLVTDSLHVIQTNGDGTSLRGGFYRMAPNCTECDVEDTTDFATPEIISFEYQFDNSGTWESCPIWESMPSFGMDGCYVWTELIDEIFTHDYYWFDFVLDVSALSPGNHFLSLRATERFDHSGGVSEWRDSGPFDPYTFINTFGKSLNFAKNGSPGISLVGPENGSYVSSGNPEPTFSAIVTDPNINQPLFAHFEVSGFNPDSVGSTTITPGTSSWGPVAGMDDGTYIWRGYAEDSVGATSSWSGYWSFTKDTMLPYASISYPFGSYDNTTIPITLIELDERTSVVQGDVQMRSRIINGTWSTWGTSGLPNSGTTTADFDFTGTRGYEYEFQYRATDGAGNVSAWVSAGAVAIASNVIPTATNLSLNNSDFCSSSPAFFFSWTYTDGDSDAQSRFDIQVDDSGAGFPSPEINRSYPGLSNPSPWPNNQAAIVLLSPQADYLTYNRTYNWRVQVYDNQVPPNASGWVNGVPFSFPTPTHRAPDCGFTWSPISPNPEESVSFTNTSNCYDISGSTTPCANWNWTFTDGNPATSTQQNPVSEFATSGSKDVTLQVIDSFGSTCSITRQVIVGLPLPKWKEIRPW